MPTEPFHIHLYGPHPHDGRLPSPETTPIPTSFEAAGERLNRSLPSVLFEPDGSFAWAGKDHQVVGMVYDAAMLIQYVEIRGHCDATQLRKLVETLAGTTQIDPFAVMVLPERQWKNFQTFAISLPARGQNRPADCND
ncbi:hypothetical protein Enr13x_00270 [Stieleria neptunia]|uniref:Uncharacterized protein n=1 Tax=Stieleria neptunia TaxID=2527979 RepID=A0A518HH99_9BACT|nr:hypothetical protein [Stieleria neptunia]QDV40221.1 hypothetical protein Enr13x_00270 [Stieleria neptunia]